MDEKTLEKKLRLAVKLAGGLALKFTSPGWDGAPDRLVLLPRGRIVFVEVKGENGRLSALQSARLETLRARGFRAVVLDSAEGIGEILDEPR